MAKNLKNIQSSKDRTLEFIAIPLVTLFIIPIFSDSNGISKLFGLILGILILGFLRQYISFNLRNWVTYFPLILLAPYAISQILKPNDIDKFLIGSPGRNGGFIAWAGLAILMLYIANSYGENFSSFQKSLIFTYIGFIFLGLLQFFDFLPWQQSMSFNGLSITLGNPNFASAMLAIMCSVHAVFILYEKKYRNGYSLFAFSLALFVLWQTHSLQGLLVLVLNALLVSALYFRHSILNLLKKRKIFLLTPFLIVGAVLPIVPNLLDWFVANGSVRQRIAYWRLSLEIFYDNFWFGVGIDNLRGKVLEYRDLALVKQEGIFTIPDRTHNVLLDHFVNGGIFAGLIWFVFICSVSYYALALTFGARRGHVDKKQLVVVVIWFGYLIQSFISVDHLALMLLGYTSAGYILSMKIRKENVENRQSKKSFQFANVGIQGLLIIFLIYIGLFFRSEFLAYKVLYASDVTSINTILNSRWVQSQTLEDVAVYVSQSKQFELANQFADKMLSKSPNSHQALYMKSVYEESLGDNLKGRDWMLKAHRVDPLNPVYLLSLAIYEYKLGNLDMARSYVEKTEAIDPNQKALLEVKNLLK